MGSETSRPEGNERHTAHRSSRYERHGRRDRSGRSVQYGGRCNACKIHFDDLERHYPVCRVRLTQAGFDASMDSEEPERPHYGKDMHPSSRNFTDENTTTPSSFNSRPIPLMRAGNEEEERFSASDSVASSDATQVPDSPPLAVSNAQAWGHTRGSSPHQDHLRPAAPFSESSGSASGLPLPQYSERYFERLGSRGTSRPVGDQSGGIGASQAAQNQQILDSSGYAASSTSYGNTSTASSVSYSYISPESLTPRPRESVSSSPPAPPSPQHRQGRERQRPEYHPSAQSSSRRPEYQSQRGRESRESHTPSRHPPRAYEDRERRQGHRDGRSRSRMSRQPEHRRPASRSGGYDNTMASEDYAPARDAGSRTGPSRPSYASPRQRYSCQRERVVFPGDRSMFSPSDVQQMGDSRFGGAGAYRTYEDEGRYFEEPSDSDDHMFSTEHLDDMVGPRGWRRNQRS